MRRAAILSLAFMAAFALSVLPIVVSAHSEPGAVKQNPALLSALVAVGGGADAFSAKTMRMRLGGSAEEVKIKAALGVATLPRFDEVFTFVVNDALSTMKKSGETLPAPALSPANTKALAIALYKAGIDDGKFNVEHLFNILFSENVHMHAMMAVGQKYGGAGETAYHEVFRRLVADIGGNGRDGDIAPDPMHHMNGMNMNGMNMPSPSKSQ